MRVVSLIDLVLWQNLAQTCWHIRQRRARRSPIRLDDDLRNVLARYQIQRDDPKKVDAEKNRRNVFNAYVMDGPAQIAMLYAAANFLSNSGND